MRKFEKDEFLKEEFKEDVSDLNKIIKDTLIDLDKQYTEPIPYLSISQGLNNIRICTEGNISAITGKAKTKKSFFQTMLIASAVDNTTLGHKIKGRVPEGKRMILVFDTEQATYDVYRVANRVKRLIGHNPNNLGVFNLRGINSKIILDLLEFVLKRFKEVGIIFIDQVADLVSSINSEEEAVSVVRYLEMLTKKYECHICCVIHQNKDNHYATGHLGSQILKKAETIINVDKCNSEVSKVYPEATRGLEFEAFGMKIKDGLPVVLDDEEFESYDEKEKRF